MNTPSNPSVRLFRKMHGLGNDFIIFDGRKEPLELSSAQVCALADRRVGIGCDQIITIKKSDKGDAFLHIQNSDGSLAEACGNATRCVASILLKETNKDKILLDSLGGILTCYKTHYGITADLGEPHLNWAQIPLAEERDTLDLGLSIGELHGGVAVNIGNPHVVFFVENIEDIDLEKLGPVVEQYPLFPERVNVNVAEVINRNTIRLRVWERGAGITRACGTGACATLVAAVQKKLCARSATINLDGGTLNVHWTDQNHLNLSGDIALSFTGKIDLSTLQMLKRPRPKGQVSKEQMDEMLT